jgi:hypothetical protein
MKLSDFRRMTVNHDGATEILVLTPWGEMEPATIVEPGHLAEDDPVREKFPPDSILLAGDAG